MSVTFKASAQFSPLKIFIFHLAKTTQMKWNSLHTRTPYDDGMVESLQEFSCVPRGNSRVFWFLWLIVCLWSKYQQQVRRLTPWQPTSSSSAWVSSAWNDRRCNAHLRPSNSKKFSRKNTRSVTRYFGKFQSAPEQWEYNLTSTCENTHSLTIATHVPMPSTHFRQRLQQVFPCFTIGKSPNAIRVFPSVHVAEKRENIFFRLLASELEFWKENSFIPCTCTIRLVGQ